MHTLPDTARVREAFRHLNVRCSAGSWTITGPDGLQYLCPLTAVLQTFHPDTLTTAKQRPRLAAYLLWSDGPTNAYLDGFDLFDVADWSTDRTTYEAWQLGRKVRRELADLYGMTIWER